MGLTGAEYLDPANIYTVKAPPGKLGVFVDTPYSGPAVVCVLKETYVLNGQVKMGDCLLDMDDEDVTFLSPVNIS